MRWSSACLATALVVMPVRADGSPALRATMDPTAVQDPRDDPAWVAKDRRLTRGILGTGIVSGGLGLGLIVSLAVAFRPSDGEGCHGCVPAWMILAPLTGVALLSLAGVAGARKTHRRPLARLEARVTAGGFQLRF
jgi:hypothetical protein